MRNYTPDLNSDFIYRGTYDRTGERSSLREARKHAKVNAFWPCWAIDMDPGGYNPVIRAFVYDVENESEALETLYEAARLMGPPKDDNRINLFTELYEKCDGEQCWCRTHGVDLHEHKGVVYHERDGTPIGIAMVTKREHLHDAGQSKIRRELAQQRRERSSVGGWL